MPRELISQFGRALKRSSPRTEEIRQHRAALLRQHPAFDLDQVIDLPGGEYIEYAPRCAGLGICGPIDQAANPCVYNRAGAHDAGFEGDVEGGIEQTVVIEHSGAVAQRDDLGMGGGITGGDRLIPALGDNLAILDQHGADRDLASFLGPVGKHDCVAHEIRIGH